MGLKELRKNAGFKQRDIACALSVNRTTVTKWENGDAFPRIGKALELAELLGCSVGDLYAPKAEKEVE